MLLRRAARPMLAAIFISGGVEALRSPQAHARAAKPVLEAVGPAVDQAVEVAPLDERPDDEMLVKIDGGVKVVAGTMLAVGKFPRLASAALAASLIPTTLAGHRFWEESDPESKPSLAWRGRKAARLAAAAAATQAASVSETVDEVSGKVSEVVQDLSGKVSGTAEDVSGRLSGAAH